MHFLHLSDLHFREGWPEEQGVVLDALFKDLNNLGAPEQLFLIFSGDIVQAGSKGESFRIFSELFDSRFEAIGITKQRRICVPGNHDISRDEVDAKIRILYSLSQQDDDETSFNDAIYSEYRDIVKPKFRNFLAFQQQFCQFGITDEDYAGKGHHIFGNFYLYTLNTALVTAHP